MGEMEKEMSTWKMGAGNKGGGLSGKGAQHLIVSRKQKADMSAGMRGVAFAKELI